MDKKVINTTKAPAPIGPYNQAVISNNMIYVSGQIPLNPETNELITGDIATETHQVMRNLDAILEEAGINFNHVVKSTIFLTDMSLFAAVNEVYGSYFSADYPARETVAVKGLPKNVNVEISMIATM
ncbi:MAG: RidA family protein [Segetibacter sp.]|jgi:2-iminobutanoate/2-iminopropanoate deaminase|nr:RidA family protein [Segetibacter sp.]